MNIRFLIFPQVLMESLHVPTGQIGRITIDGKITEYPIPTKQSEPHGIAAGPDKSIWFAEECGKIG
nr:hypothetical protein [Bacillus swezeyi]